MGHVNGNDLYRKLGETIDNLAARAPWNETFYMILKELYTLEEAEILTKMPYGLASFEDVARITKNDKTKLRRILLEMCSKGLVVDLWIRGKYRYMVSPLVIGFFEFTMMRTGNNKNQKMLAKLFHEYLHSTNSFYAANLEHGERVSILRTLPHEEVIDDSKYVEILDYEKATSIIDESDRFAIGLCSCRHEKFHIEEKPCDVPLDTCSSFGFAADYLIRHEMAREVSRSEMLENVARSKELGLLLSSDNVRKNVSFICHCCKCCCNVLLGVTRHGYSNAIVSSSFTSEIDESKCTGCKKCAKECPINAIQMVPITDPHSKKIMNPEVDASICLGCGICALKCHKDAVRLVKRKQRVLHPETMFERVILQCLERGTLQNQIFANPQSVTQRFMRGILGAFLRLPATKKALMSDALRSNFLASMKMGTTIMGNAWHAEI